MRFASGYLTPEAKCPVPTTRSYFNTTFFWNCGYVLVLLECPIPHSCGCFPLRGSTFLWLFLYFPLANSTCLPAGIYKLFPGPSWTLCCWDALFHHLPGLPTLEGETIKLEVKGLPTCSILLPCALQGIK